LILYLPLLTYQPQSIPFVFHSPIPLLLRLHHNQPDLCTPHLLLTYQLYRLWKDSLACSFCSIRHSGGKNKICHSGACVDKVAGHAGMGLLMEKAISGNGIGRFLIRGTGRVVAERRTESMETWHNIEVVCDYMAALFAENAEWLVRCDCSNRTPAPKHAPHQNTRFFHLPRSLKINY